VLADGRLGDSNWPGVFTDVAAVAGLSRGELDEVCAELERLDILVRDGPFLQIGPVGEERYGRRHFMDVTSLFLTEPLLTVRHGTRDLGQIDPSALTQRDGRRATILLGGRAWGVEDVDWRRGIAWVTPSDDAGRSRWAGSGVALSAPVCRAIRDVLAAEEAPQQATARARTHLALMLEDFAGIKVGHTTLVRDLSRLRETWWTFAGGNANAAIATGLRAAGIGLIATDDLAITMHGPVGIERLKLAAATLAKDLPAAEPDERRIESLKFGESLPTTQALAVLRSRMADADAVATTLAEPIGAVVAAS